MTPEIRCCFHVEKTLNKDMIQLRLDNDMRI